MTTGHHDRHLFVLMQEASAWPADQRAARAAELCADGPVTSIELLAALQRSDRLARFLDRPAWQEDNMLDSACGSAADLESDVEWDSGEDVGRYRLVERLGAGGMGEVWLAEQIRPVERRVALKLIRSELASEAARVRFRAEQQALARLQHPNISQLYEADSTPDGQPFLAMEWIDGVDLVRYCDSHGLSIDARLRIFVDVCAAIQHAHQRQILHRDLKPSNLLVVEVDGRPVAKVIDFGIAKELTSLGPLVDLTGGHLLGTPEFLSPESFRQDVDVRSDVYSLGVVLYRLLTGVRPYRDEGGCLGSLIEKIEQGSARLAHAAAAQLEAGDAARVGGLTPKALSRHLAGDLDAIVAKAMDPNRDERYRSAADLADDVERFLRDEPVEARSNGRRDQFVRILRRHRGKVLSAAAIVLALVLGSVGLAVGLLEARDEAAAARRAQAEAEELSEFLTGLFDQSDPALARGQELSARQMLDEGAKRLEGRFEEQPQIRARLTRTIGDIYAKLGAFDEAQSLLEESLDAYRRTTGVASSETARALHGLGVLRTQAGDLEGARGFYEEALAIQRELRDTTGAAMTRYHLGVLAFRGDDNEGAEAHFESACEDLEDAPDLEDLKARCFEAFGALRGEQGRHAEAEVLVERSLDLRREVFGSDHPHVASTLDTLCLVRRQGEKFTDAIAACEEALAVRQQVFEIHHRSTLRSMSELARTLRDAGDLDGANRWMDEALLAAEQAEIDDWSLSQMLVAGAWQLWVAERWDEAASRYRRALDLREKLFGVGDPRTFIPRLGVALVNWKLENLDEAERALLGLRDQVIEWGEDPGRLAWISWALAGVYRDRGDASRRDYETAAALYDRALDLWPRSSLASAAYVRRAEADREVLRQLRAAGGEGEGCR